MKLFRGLFKHYEVEDLLNSTVTEEKTPEPCKVCKLVPTAGRGGVKTVKFPNGDKVKVEIVNMSGVEDRKCFVLDIMVDEFSGWQELPIKYCPFCSRKLESKKCSS